MRAIWKFKLKLIDRNSIFMPKGAQLLTVQMQFDEPCLWALVDDTHPPAIRHIDLRGTGHSISDVAGPYIATFQMAEGELVWHMFDGGEETP